MIALLLTIAIAGVIVWAVTTYIPMPPLFMTAILVIAAICLLLYCLNYFGVMDAGFEMPRYHRHR